MRTKKSRGSSEPTPERLFPNRRSDVQIENRAYQGESALLDSLNKDAAHYRTFGPRLPMGDEIQRLKTYAVKLRSPDTPLSVKRETYTKSVDLLAAFQPQFFHDPQGLHTQSSVFRPTSALSINPMSKEAPRIGSLVALLNVVIQASENQTVNSRHKEFYYQICKISHIASLAEDIDHLIQSPDPNSPAHAHINAASMVAGSVKTINSDTSSTLESIHSDLTAELKRLTNSHPDREYTDNFQLLRMSEKKAHEVATSLEVYIATSDDKFLDGLMSEDFPRKLLAPLYPYLDWKYCLFDKKTLQEKTQGRTFMGLMVKTIVGQGLKEESPLDKYNGWLAYELKIDDKKRSFFAVRKTRVDDVNEWSIAFITTNSSHDVNKHRRKVREALDRLQT